MSPCCRRLLLSSSLLLVSCATAPPPPPPAAAAKAPAPATSAIASGAATAAPAPTLVPPPAPSPFVVIAHVASFEWGTIQRAGSDLLLLAGGGVARVEDGRLKLDDAPFPGDSVARTITGAWPDRAYLVAETPDGLGFGDSKRSLYRHERSSWKLVFERKDPNAMDPGPGEAWSGALAIVGNRVLGVLVGRRTRNRLVVVDGPRGAKLPELARGDGTESCTGSEIDDPTLVGAPDGRMVIAGTACAGGIEAELFEPGAKRGTLVKLAPPPCEASSIVAADASVVYAVATCADETRVYALRGTAVERIPVPAPAPTSPAPGGYSDSSGLALAAAPSGRLYALVDRDHAARRGDDGAWTVVSPPEGLAFDLGATFWPAPPLAVGKDDDVYAIARPAGSSTSDPTVNSILRWGKPASAVTELSWPSPRGQTASASLRRPRAANAGCSDNFVLLFTFTKATPVDYDFPLTRAALKGHTELAAVRLAVTTEGGKNYFGAFAPDYDTARKVVELVKREVKDARPVQLCATPETVRELKIDWSTGAIAK